MTLQELAQRAGVSTRTVWSVEKGHPCRVHTKRRILRALGVPRSEHRDVFPATSGSARHAQADVS